VPPNSCWLNGFLGLDGSSKKLRAFSRSLRAYSYPDPWNWFVPLLVTATSTPPPALPYSADMLLDSILNS
jgi:hypothetical protein